MNAPDLDIAVFINTKYSFKAPLPLGERVWGEGGVPHDNEKSYIAPIQSSREIAKQMNKSGLVGI